MSRLLADGSLGPQPTGPLAVIEKRKAMEGFLLRVHGQDDAKRSVQHCIEPARESVSLAVAKGRLG